MFLRFSVDQLEHEAKSVNRVVANKTRGHKKSKDTAAEETTAPKGQKIIRVALGLIAKRNVDQHPNRLAQLHPAAAAAENDTAAASAPSASSALGEASVVQPVDASVERACGPLNFREKRRKPRAAHPAGASISTLPLGGEDSNTLLKRVKSIAKETT